MSTKSEDYRECGGIKMRDEDFFQKSDMFSDIYYVTKGWEECAPNHFFGPTIREYYLIHIIVAGKGIFKSENEKFNLKAGQFFVIFPDEQTFYQADSEDPWEYIWFGFEGKKAKELLNFMGLNPSTPIGSIKDFQSVLPLIETMLKMDPFDKVSRLNLQGKIYWLLSILSADLKDEDQVPIETIEKINRGINYTRQAIDIIKENYANTDFMIGDISKILSLNDSYLTSVFRVTTKRTLHNYLIDYRIQKSREYLETTDYNIAEVAEKVGYKNPLSFTRIFKKKIGMTPKDYKKARKKR